VLAALASVLVCAVLLARLLARRGVLREIRALGFQPPVREVFAFTGPLIVHDLRFILGTAAAVLIVGHVHGPDEVATLKAVLPVAMLNLVVFQSFRHLLTPLASRLRARGDGHGLNEAYCLSSLWIAVLSFPAFLVTFAFSKSCLAMLYGARYEHAWPILAALSAGYYFSAALGFNSVTLRMFGRSAFILKGDLVSSLSALGLTLALTPSLGSFGAALSLCATLIGLNLYYQAGLAIAGGIHLFEWRWLRVYLLLVGTAVACTLLEQLLGPPPLVGVAIAVVASATVVRGSLGPLQFARTFPEAVRHPIARWFFTGERSGAPA
jgi:O-antigen/teichoic acid export membrane protein